MTVFGYRMKLSEVLRMKTFKKVISAAMCAAVAVSQLTALTPAVNAAEELADSLANDSGLDIDYARALQYSIYFYDVLNHQD